MCACVCCVCVKKEKRLIRGEGRARLHSAPNGKVEQKHTYREVDGLLKEK